MKGGGSTTRPLPKDGCAEEFRRNFFIAPTSRRGGAVPAPLPSGCPK